MKRRTGVPVAMLIAGMAGLLGPDPSHLLPMEQPLTPHEPTERELKAIAKRARRAERNRRLAAK
jgi:hypothetical protein